jgi:hypothetical protein
VIGLNMSAVVRLGRLVQSGGAGWVYAEQTAMLNIGVIYIYNTINRAFIYEADYGIDGCRYIKT